MAKPPRSPLDSQLVKSQVGIEAVFEGLPGDFEAPKVSSILAAKQAKKTINVLRVNCNLQPKFAILVLANSQGDTL